MPQSAHYNQADQTINHLATIVGGLTPDLRSQYTGFAAICAVTVYELAIKEVFCNFAQKKHGGYGHFVERYFYRINGRINLKDISKEYLPRFGEKYSKRFQKLLDQAETTQLAQHGISVKSSYGNLLTWRHEFAHEGRVPTNATFSEVQRAYFQGKTVIDCLERSLVR